MGRTRGILIISLLMYRWQSLEIWGLGRNSTPPDPESRGLGRDFPTQTPKTGVQTKQPRNMNKEIVCNHTLAVGLSHGVDCRWV